MLPLLFWIIFFPFNFEGGMETLETTKPGLVFDGQLNFEKGT